MATVYNLAPMKTTLLLIPLVAFAASLIKPTNPALVADTIIINAVVHTMDPAQPTAEAVAVYGNRIVAVGSTKDIRKLAGPNTRTINANGHLLLPGFNDAPPNSVSPAFKTCLRALTSASIKRCWTTLDGKNPKGWVPEQKISVDETVRAYTLGSAYAEFQENVKGSISVGKLADLVLLSRDIFKIDPNEIENVKVVLTMVDGRVVFEEL
jgi:predicted amidohydrolase YtcJ